MADLNGAQPEEKELIKRLKDPKTRRDSFADLVRIYGEGMYWRIRRIVLLHEDADDVLQNTFIKVWNNIESFRSDSKLSTWLHRIAVNESLDFMRHKGIMKTLSSDGSDSSDSQKVASLTSRLQADNYFDGSKAEALLHAAVALLPETQKRVFIMKYFEGMKYSDISRELSTSEGALKASYHIAVKKISEYFERND